jgi:hypothetical protein
MRGRGRGSRQRVLDLQQDLVTILAGVALAGVVIVCFVVVLALSFAWGVAQDWSPLAWPVLGALAVLLVSLEVMFIRDYLRWRRAAAEVRRG